jgi:hypothetical protein
MNKREFVVGGCAALTGGAASAVLPELAPAGAKPVTGLRRQRLPDLVTEPGSASWQRYVGHRFQALTAGTAVTLVLGGVAVRETSTGFDQFSLSLGADAGPRLPSGTHRLRHATGQEVTVYLENTGTAGQARTSYRADFNVMA